MRTIRNVAVLIAIAGAALTAVAGGQSGQQTQNRKSAPMPAAKQQQPYRQPQPQPAQTFNNDGAILTTMARQGNLRTFISLLAESGTSKLLQGDAKYTVFAPHDGAFNELDKAKLEELKRPENKGLLAAILSYHIVPGDFSAEVVKSQKFLPTMMGQRFSVSSGGTSIRVDQASMWKTDIACSNGVIHVIDSVLMPETNDVIDVLASAGSFKTLSQAFQTAGLMSTLEGAGPFTIFAPTDKAFEKLGQEQVQSLLQPRNHARLAALVNYHIAPGILYSDRLSMYPTIKTMHGDALHVTCDAQQWFVNNAQIVKSDVEAFNGIIHSIDAVLTPTAGTTASAAPSPRTQIRR